MLSIFVKRRIDHTYPMKELLRWPITIISTLRRFASASIVVALSLSSMSIVSMFTRTVGCLAWHMAFIVARNSYSPPIPPRSTSAAPVDDRRKNDENEEDELPRRNPTAVVASTWRRITSSFSRIAWDKAHSSALVVSRPGSATTMTHRFPGGALLVPGPAVNLRVAMVAPEKLVIEQK